MKSQANEYPNVEIKKLWSHCVKKFLDSKSNEKNEEFSFLIYVLQSIFSEILCLDSHDLCEKLQRNTPGWVGVF
jgi:hypothetical protein